MLVQCLEPKDTGLVTELYSISSQINTTHYKNLVHLRPSHYLVQGCDTHFFKNVTYNKIITIYKKKDCSAYARRLNNSMIN